MNINEYKIVKNNNCPSSERRELPRLFSGVSALAVFTSLASELLNELLKLDNPNGVCSVWLAVAFCLSNSRKVVLIGGGAIGELVEMVTRNRFRC